jgi:phenylacetate-coenzyme A ligase PaaK-like adenylate-forming protein
MDFRNFFKNKLFSANKDQFPVLAMELFHYQAHHNEVYKNYLNALGRDISTVNDIQQIPYLPAELFKTHKVVTGLFPEEIIFSSSSTTGTGESRHFVRDAGLYGQAFEQAFSQFYGEPSGYCILALLPSYLERKGSSLIYMMERLIKLSGHNESGFYLNEHSRLATVLGKMNEQGQKCLLFGVTFALLDFSEAHTFKDMENLIVMETGGMKGRRAELTREEIHSLLTKRLGVETVHSEYGMTEILSQAYSRGKGIFHCPPWMNILIRDTQDPFSILPHDSTGAVNIIDLANIDSCAFIATSDLGRLQKNGSFEITGRFDHSDVRGCNLMV